MTLRDLSLFFAALPNPPSLAFIKILGIQELVYSFLMGTTCWAECSAA